MECRGVGGSRDSPTPPKGRSGTTECMMTSLAVMPPLEVSDITRLISYPQWERAQNESRWDTHHHVPEQGGSKVMLPSSFVGGTGCALFHERGQFTPLKHRICPAGTATKLKGFMSAQGAPQPSHPNRLELLFQGKALT